MEELLLEVMKFIKMGGIWSSIGSLLVGCGIFYWILKKIKDIEKENNYIVLLRIFLTIGASFYISSYLFENLISFGIKYGYEYEYIQEFFISNLEVIIGSILLITYVGVFFLVMGQFICFYFLMRLFVSKKIILNRNDRHRIALYVTIGMSTIYYLIYAGFITVHYLYQTSLLS